MATEAEIYGALTEIFHDVFMRDDIVLSPELTAKGVQGWDSFKQIEIIMACEEKWGIKFNTRELDALRCVGDLATMVAKKAGRRAFGLILVTAGGRPARQRAHPSSKCPNARNGRRSSQTILVIASSGTARMAPGTPTSSTRRSAPGPTRPG